MLANLLQLLNCNQFLTTKLEKMQSAKHGINYEKKV